MNKNQKRIYLHKTLYYVMNLKIKTPSNPLNGTVIPPGSKAHSHRAFILAGFTEGASVLKKPLISGDLKVTIDTLKLLGVKITEIKEGSYVVSGKMNLTNESKEPIDCKNAGTTLRILTALSLLIDGGIIFKGEFLKRNRPILPLLESLVTLGAEYQLSKNILSIKRINKICNSIQIKGDISSQFITALLILCSLIKCEKMSVIKLNLTTPLVSYPYIKITLNLLEYFGINIIEKKDKNNLLSYIIETGQNLRTQIYEIPSDFSSAAFIIAATVLSPKDSKVIIKNLDFQDPQGDKKFIEIIRNMGAKIDILKEEKEIIIYGNISKYPLKGLEIDCKDIPDLFPILSVIGAFAEKKTVLFNADNLRFKESDRISVMARELRNKGVNVIEKSDGMIIHHCEKIIGSSINHEQDHRIAMACIIASLYSTTESEIDNIEIVKDSYPNFIDDLEKIGANIQKI